jgi:hypothetical protein
MASGPIPSASAIPAQTGPPTESLGRRQVGPNFPIENRRCTSVAVSWRSYLSKYSSGTSSSGTSWVRTSSVSSSSAASTPATAPASKTLPSSTNSSTLSESACSAWDRPSKSPVCRSEAAPSLAPDDANRCAPPRRAFGLRVGVIFVELFLVDFLFFAVFAEPCDFFWRADFSVRFLVPSFDVVRLLLIFFFLAIAAVYHHVKSQPDHP